MINVKNLSISFGRKIVIDSVSFSAERGTTLVMLGKNGSGKTLILKAIAGLLNNYSGTIEINNKDIKKKLPEGKSDPDNFRLAYVFQKGGLFDSMNVYENIAFGLKRMRLDKSIIEERVAGSIERMGLQGSENKLPSELSGGMQKRVGLARALCLEANVVLFDDPTAGLDPILSDSIADLLIEIKRDMDTTSIVVTHDLQAAEKVADSIILIYRGRIVFSGRSEEFFSGRDKYACQFIEGDIEGPIDIF